MPLSYRKCSRALIFEMYVYIMYVYIVMLSWSM